MGPVVVLLAQSDGAVGNRPWFRYPAGHVSGYVCRCTATRGKITGKGFVRHQCDHPLVINLVRPNVAPRSATGSGGGKAGCCNPQRRNQPRAAPPFCISGLWTVPPVIIFTVSRKRTRRDWGSGSCYQPQRVPVNVGLNGAFLKKPAAVIPHHPESVVHPKAPRITGRCALTERQPCNRAVAKNVGRYSHG